MYLLGGLFLLLFWLIFEIDFCLKIEFLGYELFGEQYFHF
jgi:hypothetical protein